MVDDEKPTRVWKLIKLKCGGVTWELRCLQADLVRQQRLAKWNLEGGGIGKDDNWFKCAWSAYGRHHYEQSKWYLGCNSR